MHEIHGKANKGKAPTVENRIKTYQSSFVEAASSSSSSAANKQIKNTSKNTFRKLSLVVVLVVTIIFFAFTFFFYYLTLHWLLLHVSRTRLEWSKRIEFFFILCWVSPKIDFAIFCWILYALLHTIMRPQHSTRKWFLPFFFFCRYSNALVYDLGIFIFFRSLNFYDRLLRWGFHAMANRTFPAQLGLNSVRRLNRFVASHRYFIRPFSSRQKARLSASAFGIGGLYICICI